MSIYLVLNIGVAVFYISIPSFWMSDEYGPYVYKFGPSGHLLQVIQPPKAFLPFFDGTLNFTSDTDPDTGRAANQGTSPFATGY